jgi:hypothetical protein
VERGATRAVFSWALPASSCPVKSAELTFSPPLRGRKSFLVRQEKAPFEYTAVGVLGDIQYEVTIRVKSSFGWSPPSPELRVPRYDWGNTDKDVATPKAKTTPSTELQTTAAPVSAVPTIATAAPAAGAATASNSAKKMPSPPPPPPKPASPPIRRTRKMKLKNPKNNEEIHKNKKYILIQRAKREAREHLERIERQKQEQSRGKGEL